MIGSLNRGKNLSASTIQAIRLAAISRLPMSDATRAKVSYNSAKAQLFSVSRLDNTLFLFLKGVMVSSDILRTLPVVASFIKSSEKTIRRAMAKQGIVKKVWLVRLLGKANNS